MRIKFLFLISLIFSTTINAQDYSNSWVDYFSYLNISDIANSKTKVFASVENSLFSYDNSNGDIEKISTINGISGENISTIQYSESNETLLIGFKNGLLQAYNTNSKEVTTIIDIKNKQSIPPNIKTINDILIVEDIAYISTDFGISTYDIANLEFGDTYFIGNGGANLKINQIAIFNDYIYTASPNGIKKALRTNPKLIDFNEWETVNTDNIIKIFSTESKLFVLKADNKIYELSDSNTTEVNTYSTTPSDIFVSQNNIIVTTPEKLFIYNSSFTLISELDSVNYNSTSFSCASILNNTDLFIGTKMAKPMENKGNGLLKTSLSSLSNFDEIHPDSPLSNTIFGITAKYNQIWLTYGEYNSKYNPYPLNSRGFSYYKNDNWTNINAKDVLEKALVLTNTIINPFNQNNVFIGSYFDGILELKDEQQTTLYNEKNSGLETIVIDGKPDYSDVRIGAMEFDNNGILWCVNSIVTSPLHSFNIQENEWRKFDLNSLKTNFVDIDVNDDYVWMASPNKGIVGFRRTDKKSKFIDSKDGNMPAFETKAVAIDKKNTVWIGTVGGLRVIYNQDEFFNKPNYQVSNIVILDDGIPKELLYQQTITDIVVDGSNNKWISTIGTGVFFLSEDGQETISHFTTDNSPLPTNDVLDLDFDESTGMVYMATQKGLVAYDSGSSNPKEQLDKAFVYPNPVRPNFDIASKKIKIKDLSSNVNIKITDVTGNLIAEGQSKINQKYKGYNLEVDGGTAFWNGNNLAGNPVASGVYSVFISDLDSDQTKALKIMIVK